jgi:quercetin dioxygenase-like cupin family protein
MEKFVKNFIEVLEEPVEMEGAKNAFIRWLIKGPNFHLRYFRIEKGGNSPRDSHNYEHEIFVLKGDGKIFIDGEDYLISNNFFVYVPPNKEHQIINIGETDLEFLCIIPNVK